MVNSNFYVKGDKDSMTMRLNQIHTVTSYCPINDVGIMCFKSTLKTMLSSYQTEENLFENIPVIDVLNAFLFSVSFCESKKVDMSKLSVLGGSLKVFENLKYVNFKFLDDDTVNNAYDSMVEQGSRKESVGIMKDVYKIECLEMRLQDMFSNDFIDFMNHIFIDLGYISNSYLERKFLLRFTYDEFFSFTNMFINNNSTLINQKCPDIIDYLNLFPVIVNEQKPDFRIITNYKEL